ncbi:hypothetical protein LDL76_15575 [Salegentibacter mishustinae]|uniref:hypothetical protein n=1 Tax=Salegentibacter mishustinae TaxID=270918 RepID=UPI001CE1E0A6|nr:hypothetical protein [Salegentibacter mishustinae]UBZ06764.1 hypothetical protein LDL76_15575 [Salegentibacter mishustinae]
MEISNYLITEENRDRYKDKYQAFISGESWYPDDFFDPDFTIFYYIYPVIKILDRQNPPNMQDYFVSSVDLLPKRGINSYMDWDKLIKECISNYRDSVLFCKAIDFMAESGETIYAIQEQEFSSFLKDNQVKIFNDEINQHSMDDGSILFGDSEKWLYYSGEVFYRKDFIEDEEYLEFDAFLINNDEVDSFVKILDKSIKQQYILDKNIKPQDFFKNVAFNERSIYKINLV